MSSCGWCAVCKRMTHIHFIRNLIIESNIFNIFSYEFYMASKNYFIINKNYITYFSVT